MPLRIEARRRMAFRQRGYLAAPGLVAAKETGAEGRYFLLLGLDVLMHLDPLRQHTRILENLVRQPQMDRRARIVVKDQRFAFPRQVIELAFLDGFLNLSLGDFPNDTIEVHR